MRNLPKFRLYAYMKGGVSIPLDQPEYIGDGLSSLDEAIEAAIEALDFIGDGVDYINVYDGDTYLGYAQDGKWSPAPEVEKWEVQFGYEDDDDEFLVGSAHTVHDAIEIEIRFIESTRQDKPCHIYVSRDLENGEECEVAEGTWIDLKAGENALAVEALRKLL